MLLCSLCPLFHHLNKQRIEKSLFTPLTHAYKLRNWHNVPWIFNNYLSPVLNWFVPVHCIVGRAELNINRPRCPAGSHSRLCQTGKKIPVLHSIDVNISKVSILTKFYFFIKTSKIIIISRRGLKSVKWYPGYSVGSILEELAYTKSFFTLLLFSGLCCALEIKCPPWNRGGATWQNYHTILYHIISGYLKTFIRYAIYITIQCTLISPSRKVLHFNDTLI